MAMAKKLMRDRVDSIAEISQRVGYNSVSAFSVAFMRYTERPPGQYSRAQEDQIPTLGSP